MLEQATNDYERLYVLDQALAAAHFLKLGDIVKQASVMVQWTQRAIAKATGRMKRVGFQIQPCIH